MNEKALLCILDGMEKKLIELMGIENYSVRNRSQDFRFYEVQR